VPDDAGLDALIVDIERRVDRASASLDTLRRSGLAHDIRSRNIRATLAIEGSAITTAQVAAVQAGRLVLAPPREVQEARNALAAYQRLPSLSATSERDLLQAHGLLMQALADHPGQYRFVEVGVMSGDTLVYRAPPAGQVPELMADLLAWLERGQAHPLVASSLFHYELEFIHPFADGNGRIGRLWQTLILSRWRELFGDLPVEAMVHAHQDAYYQAIADSTDAASAMPFVLFMLRMVRAGLDAADHMAAETSQPSRPNKGPYK
jgi:Fic family protein